MSPCHFRLAAFRLSAVTLNTRGRHGARYIGRSLTLRVAQKRIGRREREGTSSDGSDVMSDGDDICARRPASEVVHQSLMVVGLSLELLDHL